MNTSRPRRIRIMPRTARLATRYAPVRLVSITEVKSSSLIRASNWSWVIPALATRTSTGPCVASTSVKALSTAAVSRTSDATVASPATAFPEREVTVTRSPPAASRWAIARPMPLFPPVTRVDRVIGTGYLLGTAGGRRESPRADPAAPQARRGKTRRPAGARPAGAGNPRERTWPHVRPGGESPAGRQAPQNKPAGRQAREKLQVG